MNLEEIRKAINSTNIVNYQESLSLNKIVIDSRLVKKGDLYVAIIGQKLDGHNYINEAIKKGARAIITQRSNISNNKKVTTFIVKDTTNALVEIAQYKRNLYNIPIIAITGSVGKTTTKELIYQVLKDKYKILKSPKNYNNKIGVSLTLLEISSSDELIIMEMGMNHLNEIHELSMICKPDIAIITNIGTAHIGNLNGLKNIYKAKLEILDGMDKGFVLVNKNDHYLQKLRVDNVDLIKIEYLEDLYFSDINLFYNKTSLTVNYNNHVYYLTYRLPGIKMLDIILLVINFGLILDINIEDILSSISNYESSNSRLAISKINNNITLIDDTYNASIESLENALSVLKLINGRKLLIFGDFLELGKYSHKIHKKAAKLINKVDNMDVLLIGDATKRIKKHVKNSLSFNSAIDINNYLDNIDLKDYTILIKGSRLMRLENVLKYIKEKD